MVGQFIEAQTLFFLAIALSVAIYLIAPKFAAFMKRKGFYGVDVHKIDRPKVAESGGILLLPSLMVFLAVAYVLTSDIRIAYVALMASLFSLYGLLDDFVRLGKYRKLGMSLSISFVGAYLSGLSGVYFMLAMFFIVAGTNIFNLFAGLNGLEIGSSTIIAFFFAAAAFVIGSQGPFILSAGMMFMLFAFLMRNKYPASIFPGDVGTMLIGGFFSSLALYYGLWFVLVPLLSLHIFDCLLKGWSAGYFSSHEKKPTKILRSGILQPRDDFLSVIRLALKVRPMTEKRTVNVLWFIEVVIGMAVVSAMVML